MKLNHAEENYAENIHSRHIPPPPNHKFQKRIAIWLETADVAGGLGDVAHPAVRVVRLRQLIDPQIPHLQIADVEHRKFCYLLEPPAALRGSARRYPYRASSRHAR